MGKVKPRSKQEADMPATILTAGQAARRAGVTAKAVRLYEARGLLPPAERTSSGYRCYTEHDIQLPRFIRLPLALVTNTISRTRASIAAALSEAGFAVTVADVLPRSGHRGRLSGAHYPGARCLLLNSGDE